MRHPFQKILPQVGKLRSRGDGTGSTEMKPPSNTALLFPLSPTHLLLFLFFHGGPSIIIIWISHAHYSYRNAAVCFIFRIVRICVFVDAYI